MEPADDDLIDAPASPNHWARRSWRWFAAASAAAVVLIGVTLVLAARPMSWSCTVVGGPVYDVATADEAFDRWWQDIGSAEAARQTEGHQSAPIGPPGREDFVREAGPEGSASWTWEFADGRQVWVSVARTASGGWMVAANRCSS